MTFTSSSFAVSFSSTRRALAAAVLFGLPAPFGEGEIKNATLRKIRSEHGIEQSALADSGNGRNARNGWRELSILAHDAHAAGTFGHQHPSVGQKGKRPWILQAGRDRFDPKTF